MSIHNFTKTVLMILFNMAAFHDLEAQNKENATTWLLKRREYTFTAQSYSSTTVSMRQLIDYYIVRSTKDSIIGTLPYFGQSYNAQISVTDGDLKFCSVKFEYSLVEKKKGKYEITLRPKNGKTVQLMYLTVFSDSGAGLQVSSTNKKSITFYGYVAPNK